MDRVTRYILNNFFQTFLSLFLTLFFLASVVFFIKISQMTSVFNISFGDLFESYLYLLPEIIVYTFPITFFISVAMTIFKMSKDNETIVFFALSLSPNKIARIFLMLSLGATIFLLIISIVLIPIAKQLNKNFINYKKMESKINIKATQFGQKFQDWHVFINSSNKTNYSDLVLYNHKADRDEERFILASKATIDRNGSTIGFNLKNGKVFDLQDDKVRQINYDGLELSYSPENKELDNESVYAYWEKAFDSAKRAKNLSINIFVSFFPLATFLFGVGFGVANLRHEKPNIYLHIFIVVLLYYLLLYKVSTALPFIGTPLVIIGFHIASGFYFREKILKRY